MKKIIYIPFITSIAVSGCASNSHYPKGFNEPTTMHRTEVIQATRQCITAKMRPNIEYLTVKTDQGRVITPIAVHCDGNYQ